MNSNEGTDAELERIQSETADGDEVIEGIDPDITQDADPHPGV